MNAPAKPRPRVWRVRPGVWTYQCSCGMGCTAAQVPYQDSPAAQMIRVATSHAVSHLADDATRVPWWWSLRGWVGGSIVLDDPDAGDLS